MLAALALLCAASSSQAQNLLADDLARRTMEQRAVEAVIWGMPAVNTELMHQATLKLGGKPNQIVHRSGLLDWRNHRPGGGEAQAEHWPVVVGQPRRSGRFGRRWFDGELLLAHLITGRESHEEIAFSVVRAPSDGYVTNGDHELCQSVLIVTEKIDSRRIGPS
jgi:hypothetical protein